MAIALLHFSSAPSLQRAQQLEHQATIAREQGRYSEAERLFRRALDIAERSLDPNDLAVARILNHLGVTHKYQGYYDQAEACYQRALPLLERMLKCECPEPG